MEFKPFNAYSCHPVGKKNKYSTEICKLSIQINKVGTKKEKKKHWFFQTFHNNVKRYHNIKTEMEH